MATSPNPTRDDFAALLDESLGGADAGSAGLSGDFGTLSVGSALLSEAGSEHGDVAGVMTDAELEEAGISYSGTVAGLSVVASHGATVTSAGFTYDFNSLTFGAAQEGNDSAIGASYAFGDLTVKAGKATGSDAVISASYSTTVDALTVTAVLIGVTIGFYRIYHTVASGKNFE